MEEHDSLVVQVESGAQEALDKRNEGEGPLVVEQYESQAKLDAVKAQIQKNTRTSPPGEIKKLLENEATTSWKKRFIVFTG